MAGGQWLNWCQSTTCHGFADFVSVQSKARRTIWALLILVSFGLMFWQLSELAVSYLTGSSWSTSVYTESSAGLSYPTITICNYNSLPVGIDKQFGEWRRQNNLAYKTIFTSMGHGCRDTVIQAVYGSEERSLKNLCTNQVEGATVTDYLSAEFGNCFQLNLDKSVRNASRAGLASGIQLILNAQSDEYWPVLYNNYMDQGLAVQLSENSGIAIGKWIHIAPGFHTYIAFQKRRRILSKKKLSLARQPCLEKPKQLFYAPQMYSFDNCVRECGFSEGILKCGCLFFEEAPGIRTCEPEEIFECQRKLNDLAADNAYIEKVTSEMKLCEQSCEELCETTTYRTSVSGSQFPSDQQLPSLSNLLQKFGQNISAENLHKNIAALDLYFDTMHIEVVERYERVTLDQLISNIGGQLGLWAGISVLTIWQALFYLFSSVFTKENTSVTPK